MIGLLSKFFVKGDDDSKLRKGYGTLCSIVGILLNVLLFVGKYAAGIISSSIAITADAFNNLSDAGSSFITLVGFWYAGKEADTEHPFGHGRFEYISGFVVSMAIMLMGFELVRSSFNKILHPEPIDTSTITVVILIVSILVKVYMSFYNRKIGEKINSSAMKATSIDSLSDSIATTVVLLSIIIMRFTSFDIDGICGLIVACFILYAGYGAAKDTIGPLLGNPPQRDFVENIENIILSHDIVCGIHDLVVHDYGPGRVMISVHAEVPGDENIFVIHDEIDIIERELRDKLGCEAVIHMDPVEMNNEVVDALKVQIADIAKSIDENISIHDFRMVQGPTHTNIIFDAVLPFELKLANGEFIEEMEKRVKNIDSTYYVVINIDRSYVQL